jgi:hypothetical protein
LRRFGVSLCERMEGTFRCPLGHVRGLNLLSELHLPSEDWRAMGFVRTREMVGSRSGLLVTRPPLVVSPRVLESST